MGKLDDSTKLRQLMEALGVKANGLYKKLGYKSHRSVYQVLDNPETYNISPNMIERIVKAYPNVNYNFLVHDELPILLDESGMIAQSNILNIPLKQDSSALKIAKMLEMPSQLDRIERKLDELLDKRESGD